MRILCLIDSVMEPGDHWLWDYLPSYDDEVDFLWVTASDRFPKLGKLLAYYPVYLWLGIKAAVQIARKEYDLVVAWEGKNGFSLALLRSLLGVRKPKMIILAYNHRAIVTLLPAMTRFALKSVDHLTVLTKWEVMHYGTTLGIPEEKITFSPLGWYDSGTVCDKTRATQDEGFIFASGRSYRDYATFAAALEGIESKVVINARKFNLEGIDFPLHVVINDLLPMQQFWELLAQSCFVVVPLADVPHAAGDGHIIQAMAASKAVIATRGPSSETYVEEGVTGLLVPPYDAAQLREAMKYLLAHPEEAEQMGRNARRRYEERYTFSAFAQRVHDVLKRVAAEGGQSLCHCH
jgi:glycosyltransferase involved in cell wall biosynthesis